MTPYHRHRPLCCSEHRLARVHQGFGESDRRARVWTVDKYIVSEGLLSPRKWGQALVGFGTVFLVILAILSAGLQDIRL